MKIYVKCSAIQHMWSDVAQARRALKEYDSAKVDYVRECRDEMSKAVSDYLMEDDTVSDINLSAIKTDYLLGAIEDELMSEEEFDAIFDLLDTIELESAHAFA